MAYSVKYFMWPYQHLYQLNVEIELRQLLKRLSSDVESRVFLVGFLSEKREKHHTICVSPDDFELQPPDFQSVPGVAAHLGTYDPTVHGMHSHPKVQANAERGIEAAGWRQAVKQAIDSKSNDCWETFVSQPTQIEGYTVFTVAQVRRADLRRHYSLTRSTASENSTVPFSLRRSLIEAVVANFLSRCTEHLMLPNPGDSFCIVRDIDEIVRAGGKELMDAPAIAGGSLLGVHGHFDICNELSNLLYEGAEGRGALTYVDRNHPNLIAEVLLRNEVSLRDYGAVRKLLEMSNGDVGLLTDSKSIYGLGSVSADYEGSREDAFTVLFTRRFHWQLQHAGNVLMHVAFGMPRLASARFPSELLRTQLTRVFRNLSNIQIQNIGKLAAFVGRQNHGAMLIVASDASAEADRLQRQCTPVHPFRVTEAQLPRLTAIDGSVLIDTDCVCHAVGVILDGLSHEKCSASRGSRYNSAVRYVYSDNERLAIVKSEDGMVDILPQLLPQIHLAELQNRISRLRELALQSEGGVDPNEFYAIMNWLDEHRFYISAELCSELNDLWPKAQAKFEHKDFLIQYAEFQSDIELNDSYFL